MEKHPGPVQAKPAELDAYVGPSAFYIGDDDDSDEAISDVDFPDADVSAEGQDREVDNGVAGPPSVDFLWQRCCWCGRVPVMGLCDRCNRKYCARCHANWTTVNHCGPCHPPPGWEVDNGVAGPPSAVTDPTDYGQDDLDDGADLNLQNSQNADLDIVPQTGAHIDMLDATSVPHDQDGDHIEHSHHATDQQSDSDQNVPTHCRPPDGIWQ